MQALVYTAPRCVELLDVPVPAPAPGEVTLDVLAAGICGSELEGVRRPDAMRTPPLVMGHELVGRRMDSGEVVAVNPLIACRACDLCARGTTNLCRRRELVGVHRPGGFAEQVAVPVACCRPLPTGLDVMRAVLTEPIANAVHALRRAERHLGEPPRSVGVIGAGMLGIASALVAAHGGAEVAIADLSAERLAVARDTLGVHTARELDGEHDVVIDAVGAAATRASAVARLRPGGVSVWIGLHEPDAGFDSLALVRQERVVSGTFAYLNEDFAAALELAAHADPSWVEQIPLADSAARFGELLRAPGSVPKTVMTAAAPPADARDA